jgi:DNA-binding SARP family transcriptional activator/TolB-like protein
MLRLTTLGALDLRDKLGHPLREVLAQPKRMALLIYLALEGRRGPLSRDQLLAMFWPESDDAKARNTLSQALHHLRQALGPELIESQGANAIVVHEEALWCDATVFLAALEQGDVELALDVYRGEFCPTLFVSGAPQAEEWLGARRRELRRQVLGAARALAEQKATAGDAAGAARAARRALAMQPDDESDVRAMLALLDRLGDAAGALTAYQEFARRLAAELELEPAPETAQLADAIRRRREQSATALGGAALLDEPVRSGPETLGPAVVSRTERWLGRHTAIAAVLLALVAIVGTTLLRPGAPAPSASAETTVAVFPFTVRGGPAFDYLRDGMVDLLSAKLEGVSGFHAMDPRSVVAAVLAQASSGPLSAEAARQTARRLGAGWYISGDVVEVAGRLQIRGTLFDLRSGSRAATASVTGDTTALFELVDDLTGRLLVGFGSGRDTSLTRLASVTTHSLPALKAFLAGEQAMRAGRDAEAAAAYREAATLDTTFALAQYRLTLSATWVAVSGVTDNNTVAAMAAAASRHARNLAPLLRDLLSAYAAYKAIRADEAELGYRRIVEAHPDNVEAWFMLGETWFHYNPFRGRSAQESRRAFMRVLELDPTNTHALLHLARLAALDGRDGDLDSLGRVYLARYQGAERTLEVRTLLAALRHDPEERRAIARAAMGTDAIVMVSLLQAALVYGEDLDLSRALAASFVRMPKDSASGQVGKLLIADVELAAGRWSRQPAFDLLGSTLDDDWLLVSRALLAACRAVPISRARLATLRDTIAARRPFPQVIRPWFSGTSRHGDAIQAYLIGLLSARLGDTSQVRGQLTRLEAVRDSGRVEVGRDLAHALKAELAWAAGNPAGAQAELERFSFRLRLDVGHWGMHERFLMAELLRTLGRHEEALDWYLSFPAGFDQPWVAPAHLRAAQIYQRLGNRERATFHYTRFVRLWKDADPEFQPMVAQAREALARLSQ